jgi:hypothetical protein
MAKTWKECKNEVGDCPEYPARTFIDSGKSDRRAETEESAMARKIYTQASHDDFAKVVTIWEKNLRADFPNITDDEFFILLEYAREHNTGDSYEMANEMISLVELAMKLKELKG